MKSLKNVLLGAALALGLCASAGATGVQYPEVVVSMTANVWKQIAANNPSRTYLIVGDATGLSCVWSTNSAPAAGQGFALSHTTSNTYVFDQPIGTNAIYVMCATTGSLTVATQ